MVKLFCNYLFATLGGFANYIIVSGTLAYQQTKKRSVRFRSLHLSFEVLDYLICSNSTQKPTP